MKKFFTFLAFSPGRLLLMSIFDILRFPGEKTLIARSATHGGMAFCLTPYEEQRDVRIS